MVLLISSSAALVATIVHVRSEFLVSRQSMIEKISMLAKVIGINSVAALTSGDKSRAQKIISSLRAEPNIVDVLLVDSAGKVFAAYTRPGLRIHEELPRNKLSSAAKGYTFDSKYLDVIETIMLGDEIIGSVHIRSDLNRLNATLRNSGAIAAWILAGALLIAYILSHLLRETIIRPILDLAETMRKVSEEQKYIYRLEPEANDEIGILVSGFNRMLSEIQNRDKRLTKQDQQLAEQVKERTCELLRANLELKQSIEEAVTAKENAEAANQTRNEFLTRMSHELRTPINGILGTAELLLNTPLSEKQYCFIETVGRSGVELLDIVNDILLDAIEGGKSRIMALSVSNAHPPEPIQQFHTNIPVAECGVVKILPNQFGTALVLIVDDDQGNRYLAKEYLELAGYETVEAGNGVEALSVFVERDPDIVLLDVHMPQMDGFEACRQLRKIHRGAHVPILMVTGMDDHKSVARAYELGATDVIVKPINFQILTQRLIYTLRSTKMAEELSESKSQLITAQQIAKLGYWHWEINENKLHWSVETGILLGFQKNRNIGTLETLLDVIHPEDRKYVNDSIKGNRQPSSSIEYRVLLKDGTIRFICQTFNLSSNEIGVDKLIGTIQDITERRYAEDQIRLLAYRDPVTELPNRAYLKDLLDRLLVRAERLRHTMAIYFIDLDQFKVINDTMGHSAGDRLLYDVAKRLVECVRQYDEACRPNVDTGITPNPDLFIEAVSRFGGDEFVIVVDGIDNPHVIANLAERINACLSPPFSIHGQELLVTASIGISTFPQDATTVETILQHADIAMYHCKEDGGDGYKFFSSERNEWLKSQMDLKTELRIALEDDQFTLFYQPKVDLDSGLVAGMEALIRWNHPEKGLITPDKFIPLMEQSGLIIPLGDWVLRTACAQAKAWQKAGIRLQLISVNLSPVQLGQKNFCSQITQILDQAEFNPQHLDLELTETTLMENMEVNINLLSQLREVGISISIDDFGTGYSSFAYLKRLPVTTLKIDRLLVQDIGNNKSDDAIVTTIIELAHNLQLKVVAEGVEDDLQLEFLHSQGCDEAQGDLFTPPLSAEAFIEWLEARE